MKIKTPMKVFFRAVAVNNGGGDDVRVVGVGAADSDGFAEKIDVAVAGAGVSAGGNDDGIALNRGIDGRLDSEILARHEQFIG